MDPDASSTGENPPVMACNLIDPSTVPAEDETVVPQALGHLRTAARYACGAVARNNCYPPELPVAVLADTTAAMYEVARMSARYVGDYWAEAGARTNRAADLLAQVRELLDAARHHTILVPADNDPGGPAPTAAPAA
ncbi:hypothetical protein AB0368_06655 [Actinoplanes sp. NPDC051475]|uniref:hypothetical protein n=1 Tax=Actinoplanes sp. NPDC051475 TaxID=3157225 RepID=UPI00345050DA